MTYYREPLVTLFFFVIIRIFVIIRKKTENAIPILFLSLETEFLSLETKFPMR